MNDKVNAEISLVMRSLADAMTSKGDNLSRDLDIAIHRLKAAKIIVSALSYHPLDFAEWTCIFPGKMGLSWKRAWDGVGTKEEAEIQAMKHCNTVAVPLALFEHIRNVAKRMVEAKQENVKLKTALGRLMSTCFGEDEGDPPKYNSWSEALEACKFIYDE